MIVFYIQVLVNLICVRHFGEEIIMTITMTKIIVTTIIRKIITIMRIKSGNCIEIQKY